MTTLAAAAAGQRIDAELVKCSLHVAAFHPVQGVSLEGQPVLADECGPES